VPTVQTGRFSTTTGLVRSENNPASLPKQQLPICGCCHEQKERQSKMSDDDILACIQFAKQEGLASADDALVKYNRLKRAQILLLEVQTRVPGLRYNYEDDRGVDLATRIDNHFSEKRQA
jgi:hypothetical protein